MKAYLLDFNIVIQAESDDELESLANWAILYGSGISGVLIAYTVAQLDDSLSNVSKRASPLVDLANYWRKHIKQEDIEP